MEIIDRKNHGGILLALTPRVLFTAIGLSILWFLFLRPFMEGSAAKTWPTAKGTVISAHSEMKRSRPLGDTRRNRDMYKDVVLYRYVVGDKDYEGRRIGVFTNWFVSLGGRADQLQKYPEGKIIKVYYNPLEPGRALLQPGMGPDRFVPYTLLAPGGWFSILGVFSIINTLARRN